MRLKSLEAKGFKSFGDKVTIHFDKGVTSIVGPNGSGKSNVVDSIRWVLGEQKTRMLRLEKMDNVIFNGTKNRKPANVAEVSLTFENTKNILPTEYTDVCITRKLYRSGDSEYLLNGVPCRLKDITNLFLDTGIGPDSYAIIELKMVDDILSDRNDTIRLLFEEAAGISKYKIRKKQTFARLAETDADLNRVNDLLFEVEKSMKQLESQARKTERFYKLKGEYKENSVTLALFNLVEFKLANETLQKREQEQEDARLKLVSEVDKLEAGLQANKTIVLDKEKALAEAQRLQNDLILKINNLENENKNRKDRLTYLEEKKLQLQTQNKTDEEKIVHLNEEIIRIEQEKTSEEVKLNELNQELLDQKKVVGTNKDAFELAQQELKDLNQKLYQVRQEINKFETEMAVRKTRFHSLSEEIKRVSEQILINNQKIAQTDEEIGRKNPDKENAQNLLQQLREDLTQNEKKIADTEEDSKKLNIDLSEINRKLDARKHEFELTKNLLDQLEGYPESIRHIKKSHSDSKKLFLLSDIISVEETYKLAIENYLEPFLNYFVAADSRSAWEGLEILKDSGKGKANFFVLDKVKIPATTKDTPEGCIPAISVVETKAEYKPLIDVLLHNVFIINSDQNLRDLQLNSDAVVVLSKNGNFVRQSYTLSGGSVGLFDGKRTGKQKNLETLSTQIDSLTKQANEAKESYQTADKKLNELKLERANLYSKIKTTEENFSGFNLSISALNSSRDLLLSTIETHKKTVDKLQEDILILSPESGTNSSEEELMLNKLTADHQALIEIQKNKQDELASIQNNVNESNQQYNQINIYVIQQQNKLQNLSRETNFKSGLIENLKNSIESNTEQLGRIEEQTASIFEELSGYEERLRELIGQRDQSQQILIEKENDFFKVKGDIDEEDKMINELRKKRENIDLLIRTVHEEINTLKLNLTSLKERLHVEFEIDINTLLDQDPPTDVSEEQVKDRNDKLKNSLSNYGPINPMALESFNEVKERFDFISKEKDDLAQAKQSLLQTIAEIDQTAKEKFMEAYLEVRQNFIKVFRSLFSEEDNCDLVLLDMENPLESDIHIVAQPKGKKPLSIHQLSGGEKTLTATALLFGLYLLKPAPFCIFDEVDAPLDDANIDKFNNIIQTFSKDSQFIIITHNKRTMSFTDIMYGITMNEPGITQVIPVDMREYA
ncbi:MAG TPA: chromosome segregation protein SMC [Bacteroidia bacterium]|nr:chromosome segregation protein SMC [Bacteroidia bacterium]